MPRAIDCWVNTDGGDCVPPGFPTRVAGDHFESADDWKLPISINAGHPVPPMPGACRDPMHRCEDADQLSFQKGTT